MGAVEDRRQLLVVVRRESVKPQAVLVLDVRLALRNLLGRDARRREELRQVRSGEALDRTRVGDLVHATADEQVARQRPGGWMVHHLVEP